MYSSVPQGQLSFLVCLYRCVCGQIPVTAIILLKILSVTVGLSMQAKLTMLSLTARVRSGVGRVSIKQYINS